MCLYHQFNDSPIQSTYIPVYFNVPVPMQICLKVHVVPEASGIITCWAPDTWQLAAVAFKEVRDLDSTNTSATDSLCDFGKTTSLLWVIVSPLYNKKVAF